MNSDELDKLRVAKVKCLNSLEFFIRYFFKKTHNKKFIVSKHHKIIIEALEDVVRGKCKRLIINLPPRYGKTEIAVKGFIAWCMALNSECKFIHTSYSDSLALDNSEEIKDLISSEEFQQMFPNVTLKHGTKAKNKWYTSSGGGVLARSSSGQITGFGAGRVDEEAELTGYPDLDKYWSDRGDDANTLSDAEWNEFFAQIQENQKFAGAIIIDDPIKPDDASSDTIRDKVNTKFETTIRSRVNSRNTPIVVIMQRLDEQDLSGYLMSVEPDEWQVISLPAIQSDGTALWEHKHTVEELQKLRKINEFVFETQYMQNPQPLTGLLFPKNELNYYNGPDLDIKQVDFRAAFVDVADDGADDHSVPFGYVIGQRIYIHDVLYTKEGTSVNVGLTAEKLNKHKPEWCRVESNMGGGMYTQLLRAHTGVQLLPIRAKSNKHTRIYTLSGFIKEFCYFRTDYEPDSDYDRFMKCLTRYLKSGESKHDDAPDSLHGLCNMIRRFYAHLYPDYIVIGDDGEAA